ncbi:uncharacterized protein LOC135423929 isoform X1 [Pseudopipra pipra]|uniref:uncharacterized protein LOC135423929 isoform X1 n=1 Tax=Pseudopipra pipra TaxID=415032 RepID=UPI00313A4D6F
MAVSGMSRSSRRRRAYALRQPPERAEQGTEAHSAHFGNFRNLPKQAKMALGARSAISGKRDAASYRLPRSARQFPTTEQARETCSSRAEAAPTTAGTVSRLVFGFFIYFIFPEIAERTRRLKARVIISWGGSALPLYTRGTGRERAGAPHPRNIALAPAPSPSTRAGGNANYTFWHQRRHIAGPRRREADSAAARSALPRTAGIGHTACSGALLSSPPSSPPSLSLWRPRTHRSRGKSSASLQ